MRQDWRIDPVLLLLFAGLCLFTLVLIFVEWRFNSDGQIFQVVSGVLTGFAGAFFTRMNPKKQEDTTTTATVRAEPPGATVTTQKTE